MKHVLARLFVLLSVALLAYPPAFGKGNRPPRTQDAFVCGTSVERDRNALAAGKYHDDVVRRRLAGLAPRQLGSEPAAVASDVGDVAVIEDDGTIVSEPNPFDLHSKSFRFEPISVSAYRVLTTATVYNASGGTGLHLADDDTVSRDLGFAFTFYGKTYTSVQLNSDGNLTFVTGDTATSARDMGRFVAGPPRIGPFFGDLDPSRGTIYERHDTDGVLFAWDSVPQYSDTGSSLFNSFSAKLFKDGTIEFVYGSRVDSPEAIVGIAPGSDSGPVNSINYAASLPTGILTGVIVEQFTGQLSVSETALARKFFQTHPDAFDHLNLFLGFEYDLGGNAYAYELNIRNEISGIALDITDHSANFGSSHRLRSFLNMGTLSGFVNGFARYPDDPSQAFLGTNSTVSIMGQESGHRWLAFTPFRNATTGALSYEDLGRDDAHWSFFMDSDGSVMEGNDIQDRGTDQGNRRFLTVGATNTYSLLDQYIMGLVGKEAVPPTFVVENVTGTLKQPASNPSIGVYFGGTRRDFTVDDIIAVNGNRSPSVFQAPKVFRQAFIYLTRRGQAADAAEVRKVQRIRDAWVEFFTRETQGRGWIVTNLQDTPATTPTRILFPYFQGNEQRNTGIALANWGSQPADVTFQAYDNSGNAMTTPANIINPSVVTLPPGQQIAMLAEQIHGLLLTDPPRNGWIAANSTSSEVTGIFLDEDVPLTQLDGAAAGIQTGTVLVFGRALQGPGIFGTRALRTLIDVVNPNSSPAQVSLSLVSDKGETKAQASRTLAANGRFAEDLNALFPGFGTLQSWYVRLTSTNGVVGYQSVETGADLLALPGQAPSAASRLYSAQFASGPAGTIRYFTDVNIINTSAQQRRIDLMLVGNNGAPVAGIANPVAITLQPGEQRRERGDSLFSLADPALASALVDGSLVLTADGPGIVGDVIFGDVLSQKFIAALPLDGNPVSNFVLSQVAQGSPNNRTPYFTGLALYNPNSTGVQVTIRVYSQTGDQTGATTLLLPAGNRFSKTLPELVPQITNQVRGYIRVASTGGPVVGYELFGDQESQFLAAVPPQPIQP